jgi:hypothetical protein
VPGKRRAAPRSVAGPGHHHTIDVGVDIPLAGAAVDLLLDAARDKSTWMRKIPLKVTFRGATPPYSESSFVLFTPTAAEKEQWCARCVLCALP